MGIISGIVNAIGQKKQNDTNKEIADKNLQLQKDNFEYQKQIQKEIFNREDNAVQRRAEDYQKAGMNRLMGIEGANAGGVVATQAPQNNFEYQRQNIDFGEGDLAGTVMNAITMKQGLKNSKAEENFTNAKANNERMRTEGIRQENLFKELQNTTEKDRQRQIRQDIEESKERQRNIGAKTEQTEYDTKIGKATGTKSGNNLIAGSKVLQDVQAGTGVLAGLIISLEDKVNNKEPEEQKKEITMTIEDITKEMNKLSARGQYNSKEYKELGKAKAELIRLKKEAK